MAPLGIRAVGRETDGVDRSFVKQNAAAPPGFFEFEAAGLRWLAEATHAGGPPIAPVVEVRPGRIELERLALVRPTAAAAEGLGQQLAALHAYGADGFGALPGGWAGPAYIGRQVLPQADERTYPSWGAFFADLRVAPFAASAQAAGNLSDTGRHLIDRVCHRLRSGDFDDGSPPARTHGDLWAGNVVFAQNGATLIDPSAHGGHGQSDLAMLELFGLAHLERVEAAYAEAARLPPGWRERKGLHQLYPLLVHATSHGPSYGSEAERTARRYA